MKPSNHNLQTVLSYEKYQVLMAVTKRMLLPGM